MFEVGVEGPCNFDTMVGGNQWVAVAGVRARVSNSGKASWTPSTPLVLLLRGASLRSNRRDSGRCVCTYIPEQGSLVPARISNRLRTYSDLTNAGRDLQTTACMSMGGFPTLGIYAPCETRFMT